MVSESKKDRALAYRYQAAQPQAEGKLYYAGLNALYQSGKVQEVACWAHVRRKFYEIAKSSPGGFADEVLSRIAELYAIEADIRGQSVDIRSQECQARAGPLVAALKKQLELTLSPEFRKSSLAKAIHYALTRWTALTRYIDDGFLDIDNNAVERQIRPVALGRKTTYLQARTREVIPRP